MFDIPTRPLACPALIRQLPPVFYSKNYQIYTIALEEFRKSVIFWYQRLEIRIEVIGLRR